MGQSTNALMAFGFDLGEELPASFTAGQEDGEDFDIDEFLLADYNTGIPDWTPDGPPDYFKKKEAALNSIPVDIVMHCSGEYPMYFLAVRGTQVTARRGYPEEVDPKEIHLKRKTALKEFCDKHGIEWREPKWHIFSMWF